MQSFSKPQRRFLTGAMIIIMIALYVQFTNAKGGDKTWLLALAHLWVSGKTLYHGLFQPNTPLITWLYALPVYLGEHSPIDEGIYLALLSMIFVVLSLVLCFALVRHHPMLAQDRYKQWQHSALLAFIFIVWINPAFFGDRDNLAMLCLFPYALRYMPSLTAQKLPRNLLITVALFGSVSIWSKPHAIIFIAVIQLLSILRMRSLLVLFSFENLVFTCSLLIYLLMILGFTSEYLTVVWPILLATYSDSNMGIGRIIPFCTSAFMLAVTLVEFRLRYRSPFRQDIFYMFGLCVAGLLYVLGNNGWLYTYYPMQGMIYLLTLWVYWEFDWLKKDYTARGEPIKSFQFGMHACALNFIVNTLIVLAVYCVALLPQDEQQKLGAKSRIEAEVIAVLNENHAASFGMISAQLSLWPDIMQQTHASFETRFNHLWMLNKFFNSDAAFTEHYRWILDYLANAYAEDLNHNKPVFMIVDAADEFYLTGKKVDLVAYFSVYTEFAQAWQPYGLLKVIDHCSDEALKDRKHKGLCRYSIYKRNL